MRYALAKFYACDQFTVTAVEHLVCDLQKLLFVLVDSQQKEYVDPEKEPNQEAVLLCVRQWLRVNHLAPQPDKRGVWQ